MTSILRESLYTIKLFTALFFVVMSISFVHGQSLSDIQNVKVDNLSDAQIEQLIKRAESSGMSEQQLEAMARERGMPATEVAKLRARVNQIRSKGGLQSVTPNTQMSQSRQWIQEDDFREDRTEAEKPYQKRRKNI